MHTTRLAFATGVAVFSYGTVLLAHQDARVAQLRQDASSDDWRVRRGAFVEATRAPEWTNEPTLVGIVLLLYETEEALIHRLYDEGRAAENELGTAFVEYTVYELGEAAHRILQERPSRQAVRSVARGGFSPDSVFAVTLADAALAVGEFGVFADLTRETSSLLRLKGANLIKLAFTGAAAPRQRRVLEIEERRILVNALVALTRDPETAVRRECVRAMGESGEAALIPLLEAVAKQDSNVDDPSVSTVSVRKAARDAAEKLRRRVKR